LREKLSSDWDERKFESEKVKKLGSSLVGQTSFEFEGLPLGGKTLVLFNGTNMCINRTTQIPMPFKENYMVGYETLPMEYNHEHPSN